MNTDPVAASCMIFTFQNCLLRLNEYGERTVIVTDFGLAREVAGNAETPRKLSVVGSPYFMAPEILNYELYNSKVGYRIHETPPDWVPFCSETLFNAVISESGCGNQ